MKYTVYVSREFTQHGEVIVDSENKSDARDSAYKLLFDGDDSIKWHEEMESRDVFIQDIEPYNRT